MRGRALRRALARRVRPAAPVLVALLACGSLLQVADASFTARTSTAANTFSAGTVVLSDDRAAGSVLLSAVNMKPGDSATTCYRVSYTGSLPVEVRLRGTTTGTGLGSHVRLTVTRGTLTATSGPSCSTFTAAGSGTVYSGTLSALPSTYATGRPDPTATTWGPGNGAADTRAFQVVLSVTDAVSADGLAATQAVLAGQGLTSSTTLTWEAQS
ncbi:hypothetical protein [Kineococcus glutinatus]|uniref:Uncharacterized protein n=1 Tax=Kineococcus glutinatus TaxID=1070872 RepID=A0ABP8VE47_9ACTN